MVEHHQSLECDIRLFVLVLHIFHCMVHVSFPYYYVSVLLDDLMKLIAGKAYFQEFLINQFHINENKTASS